MNITEMQILCKQLGSHANHLYITMGTLDDTTISNHIDNMTKLIDRLRELNVEDIS